MKTIGKMTDQQEVPVVDATIIWECPACTKTNGTKAFYRCFTRFVYCSNCDKKAIPNTEWRSDETP